MKKHNASYEAIHISNEIGPRVPEWALLVPFGEPVKGDNGDFFVGAAEAQSVVNSFRRHGTDMLIDYRHRSFEPASVDDMKAAGWIKEMRVDNSGVMGRVEWTNKARAAIAAREFRYLSPVVLARKSNRRVFALNTCGLTNTPAIEGMVPIVNSSLLEKESNMDAVMQALRELLGLGAEATEEEILAGIAALKEKLGGTAEAAAEELANSRTLLKWVANELRVSAEGDVEAISNSIRGGIKSLRDAASNDAAKLAIDQLKAANERIAVLEKKQGDGEWDAFVLKNSKKIPPAQVEHYRKLWDAGQRESVIAIVNASPELVHTEPGKPGGSGAATDRMAIINSARSEYKTGHVFASEAAVVSDALRTAGLKPLSDEEIDKLAIVA